MDNNKKIAVNTIIIYTRLIIITLINVYLSRVVLDALGVSDFGLYNVVGGIVILINVLNSSMASTTYRYLAFELGKGTSGCTDRIFNTSFFIHGCFALLIILGGIPLGDWYISYYLNIPNGNYTDAYFVFHFSIMAAAINTLLVPYQGLLVAYEKFIANALIDIFSNILKLGVILLLIYSVSNRLRVYSLIMLGYTIVSGISYVTYCWYKHNKVVRFHFYRDKSLFKEMLSFSGWTLYGAAANVGRTQGSAIVINYFFGTIINAAYAIASQIESFVLMFARTLNSAAVPQTTKSYSSGDTNRSISLTSRISKYTFILMSMASFPLLIETDFVLGIWLKEIPEYTSNFCKFIILGNLLGCLGEGIPNLINASGRIKAYQIVVHTILLLGLPISIVLYKGSSSVYTIAIVYCFINLINSFVKLLMLRRVVKFDVIAFMRISHYRVLLSSVPLVLFYYLYEQYYNPQSVSGHVVGLLLSIVFFMIVTFCLGLEKSERNILKNYVQTKTGKFVQVFRDH